MQKWLNLPMLWAPTGKHWSKTSRSGPISSFPGATLKWTGTDKFSYWVSIWTSPQIWPSALKVCTVSRITAYSVVFNKLYEIAALICTHENVLNTYALRKILKRHLQQCRIMVAFSTTQHHCVGHGNRRFHISNCDANWVVVDDEKKDFFSLVETD